MIEKALGHYDVNGRRQGNCHSPIIISLQSQGAEKIAAGGICGLPPNSGPLTSSSSRWAGSEPMTSPPMA